MKNYTSITQQIKILVGFILFTTHFSGLGQTLSTISEDNANNYGINWVGNGGTNFDAWVFQNFLDGGSAGQFLEVNANSASPAISNNNKSFGTFANGGSFPRITAFRGLGENLQPGDSFTLEIQHGGIENGGSAGFTLRTGNNNLIADDYNNGSRFEIAFVGGGSNYSIFAGITTDTGVPFTFGGLRIKVTLIDLNTVDVLITNLSNSNVTLIEDVALGGNANSPIESIALFNRNARQANVYFNNLIIERPTFSTVQPGGADVASTWANGDIPNGTGRINIDHEVTVNAGEVLEATDLVVGTNGVLTLESTSDTYSSLIVDDITHNGTINYSRFVNAIGSGAPGTGGNDLISAPVGTDLPGGYIFQDLIDNPSNSGVIASSGTQYAFAPFNNTDVAYVNYQIIPGPPPDPAQSIIAGQGYRVASTAGANVTFTGPFSSAAVSIGISSPGTGSQWNLIGNPYPSYISSTAFLTANTALLLEDTVLDPQATAIYAYNSGTYTGGGSTRGNFTIINGNTNSGLNIAPGQGFFVASDTGGGSVQFLPSMRTAIGTDDFIEGRSSFQNDFLVLELEGAITSNTSFYFNENSSRGLDPGYDAAAFGENANNAPIYSHLVEDNTGRAMAMQSLGTFDFEGIVVPLGVNSDQGNQVRFSINESTLPSTINVYLEDQVTNTMTLLNTSDYVFTPTTNLSGTGRFFLHFADSALSTGSTNLEALNIYTNKTAKTIVIAGQLLESTTANLYDLQGRLVTKTQLETTKINQSIDVSNFATGIYVVQLSNANKMRSQKVIIR